MISRRSHQAEKTPAYAGAPTERLKYAPSIPHWSPRMKASPQITSAEPRIRMPAWRSASPKKRKTFPLKTAPITRAQNLAMSPKDAIQSRGTLSQPVPMSLGEHAMRASGRGRDGEHGLGEDVVEGKDPEELDHHALVHGSTHTFGASGRSHPFVTGDDRDDRAEQRGLYDRSPEVGGTGVV